MPNSILLNDENSKCSKRKTKLYYLNNYTSIKLKNKAAKLGIYIPIKPNQNIYQ